MADKARRGLNFETIGSIAAIVIGACALFVAWDQAQIMRKQQHASVLPAVNVASGFSTEDDGYVMTVTLRNDGIGPAMIESAALYIDGEAVKDWPDMRDRLLPPALHHHFSSSLDSAAGMLAAGERSEAIRIVWPRNDETRAGFEALKARVFAADPGQTHFSVCYCSVFDKCWISGPETAVRPQPVRKCENPGDDVVARLLMTIAESPQQ